MEKVKFIFGTINAPPVAASDDELEGYYQNSTKPFLTQLYRCPEIPVTMFFTGPLLDWLSKHHPEYITVLGEMLKRKQVEILGGAYFSPLLPLIPHNDRLGQLEDLTTLVRKLLGKRPRGCWITKGAWESALVTNLNNSGMEFTFLSEESFQRAGLASHEAWKPRVMENHGKLLTIIPEAFRFSDEIYDGSYLSFFQEMEARSRKEDAVLTILLPVENLAGHPFFAAEWGLERFITLLRDYFGVWEGLHPAAYLKRLNQTPERFFFPNTSYEELLAHSPLPYRGIGDPSRQNFRQFLQDFPESNLLYSKMIFVHLMAYQIRGDKYKKKAVLEDLWRAQAHHGVFQWRDAGFLESRHRKNAYAALITAESATKEKTSLGGSLSALDFDLDSVKEFLFLGRDFNFYVDPKGACLLELDYFRQPWNYQDILGDYFQNTVPARKRRSFCDLITLQDSNLLTAPDLAGFRDKEFKVLDFDRDLKTVTLSCRGEATTASGHHPFKLKKKYSFSESGLVLEYELENLSTLPWKAFFVSEFYLSMKDEGLSADRDNVEGLGIRLFDKTAGLHFSLNWDPTARFEQGVYETRDPAEKSLTHYQAHYFFPFWEMDLSPGDLWKRSLTLELKANSGS